MTTWLIVPPDQLDDLAALNAINPLKNCTCVQTYGGLYLTNADKLGDTYWADYQEWLQALEVFEGEPDIIPPPNEG